MLDFKYKLMKKKQFFVVHQRQLPQKTLRVMKLTLILCLVFLIKVNARGFSQDIRVSLDCQNERLGDVFKELEKLGSAFVLYRGYEVSGVSDMLFGVQEQGAVRLLKQMGHFELDDDGDLMAWIAGTEAAPGYYDISLRTLTEYRLEEIREKELLQYKNGKAVLKSILRQVGSDSGKIQILSGENDRIHVNLSDAEGSWYETWKVENDRLVLTDSGEGSVKEVHESGDVSGQNAVSQNSAVSDREADSISENNAAASDRTGSIDTRSVTKSGQKSENGTESPAFDFSAPDGTAKETQTEQE